MENNNLNNVLLQIINQTEKNQQILIDELTILFEKIINKQNLKIDFLKKNTLSLIDEKNNENTYYSFLKAFDIIEKRKYLEKNKENINILKEIFKSIERLENNEVIMKLYNKLINNINNTEDIIKLALKANLLNDEEKNSKEFIKYLSISKMLLNVSAHK